MPCLSHLRTSGPYGLREAEARDAPRRRAFFSSRVQRLRLVKSCALSAASFWVKWTT